MGDDRGLASHRDVARRTVAGADRVEPVAVVAFPCDPPLVVARIVLDDLGGERLQVAFTAHMDPPPLAHEQRAEDLQRRARVPALGDRVPVGVQAAGHDV